MPVEKKPKWQTVKYRRSKFFSRNVLRFADSQMPTCPYCRQRVLWEVGFDFGLRETPPLGRYYFRCPTSGCGAVLSMYAYDMPKNVLLYGVHDLSWRLSGAAAQKMTRIDFAGANEAARSLDGRELPFAELAELAGW